MDLSNEKFIIQKNNSEPLYLNNDLYGLSTAEMTNSAAELGFNTAAFDDEKDVCGTECMITLTDYWHKTAEMTNNYRWFCLNALNKSLSNVQTSINTTTVNVANALDEATVDTDVFSMKDTGSDETSGTYEANCTELIRLMECLNDKDKTNDADAIEAINLILNNIVYVGTVDGKRCLVYDTAFIDYCINNSEEKSLLYGLMSDLKNNIPANGVATEMTGYKKTPSYSLEISQLMAGYQLTLSADSTILFGSELKNEKVAYYATEETAQIYFYDEDKINWDHIKEWFNGESVPVTSAEYSVLAYAIEDMSDADISKLLMMGEKPIDASGYGYDQSDKLGALADRCVLQAQIEQCIGIENVDNYTRAVLIKNITDSMYTSGVGKKHIITISSDEDYGGNKIYSAEVTVWNKAAGLGDAIANDLQSRNIVVYPQANSSENEGDLDKIVGQSISNIAPGVTGETADFIIDQTAGYILEKVGGYASIPYTYGSELIKLKEAYEQSVEASGAVQMLNYGNGVECMYVSGSVVHISGSTVNSAYVYSPQYDEINLLITVVAYNRDKGKNYTSEDMKKAFNEQSELFDDYREWYKHGGDAKAKKVFAEVEKHFKYNMDDVENMDLTELEDYFEEDK